MTEVWCARFWVLLVVVIYVILGVTGNEPIPSFRNGDVLRQSELESVRASLRKQCEIDDADNADKYNVTG